MSDGLMRQLVYKALGKSGSAGSGGSGGGNPIDLVQMWLGSLGIYPPNIRTKRAIYTNLRYSEGDVLNPAGGTPIFRKTETGLYELDFGPITFNQNLFDVRLHGGYFGDGAPAISAMGGYLESSESSSVMLWFEGESGDPIDPDIGELMVEVRKFPAYED